MLAALRLLALGACAGLALSASSARAATTCYDETGFPAVTRIAVEGDEVRLVLGSSPSLVEQPPHPVLRYSRRAGWSVLPSLRCQDTDTETLCPRDEQNTGCAARIPTVSLSREELAPLRPDLGSLEGIDTIEQVVGSCVESGPYLWFGLRFYAGEGITGAGGFGRMHAETGVVEIRRPAEVRPDSVDQVVHDGGTLYVATASHRECVGDPPAQGLLAYRWEDDRIERVPTCGRVIHDVQLVRADLWVATDMGLSIGTPDPAPPPPAPARRIWKHYEPRPELPEVMREASCLEIYARVFEAPFRRSSSDTGLDPAGQLRAVGYGEDLFRDLTGANLEAQNLSGQSLVGARLSGAYLHGASLAQADLRGAQLDRVRAVDANLSHADLRGADLREAHFGGSDLAGADLRNARAHDASFVASDMSGADLRGADCSGVDLSGVDLGEVVPGLTQAQLDEACADETTSVPVPLQAPPLCAHRQASSELVQRLLAEHAQWLQSDGREGRRADLRGPVLASPVELSGAKLERALLRRAELSGAKLERADLRGADLAGAWLPRAHLRGADMRQAELTGAELEHADLSEARLGGASLRGAHLWLAQLRAVDLEGARLQGADAFQVDLTQARLAQADLTDARLGGARADGALLSGAKLTRTRLEHARLVDVDLTRADLSGASLEGATLSGARLAGATLDGIRLAGADLRDAVGLEPDQLVRACGDARTRLPEGLSTLPTCPRP